MTNQIVYRQGDVALKLVDKPKGKVRGKFGQVLLAKNMRLTKAEKKALVFIYFAIVVTLVLVIIVWSIH